MTDYMDYLEAMRQGATGAAEGPTCPACQMPLSEEHQGQVAVTCPDSSVGAGPCPHGTVYALG